jgi:hypothetical protein
MGFIFPPKYGVRKRSLPLIGKLAPGGQCLVHIFVSLIGISDLSLKRANSDSPSLLVLGYLENVNLSRRENNSPAYYFSAASVNSAVFYPIIDIGVNRISGNPDGNPLPKILRGLGPGFDAAEPHI